MCDPVQEINMNKKPQSQLISDTVGNLNNVTQLKHYRNSQQDWKIYFTAAEDSTAVLLEITTLKAKYDQLSVVNDHPFFLSSVTSVNLVLFMHFVLYCCSLMSYFSLLIGTVAIDVNQQLHKLQM